MHVGNTTRSSYVWRSIRKALAVLCDGWRFRLCSGNSSVWYEDQALVGPLCNHVPYVHISNSALLVRDIWDSHQWNLDLLTTQIPLPLQMHLNGIDGLDGSDFEDG